MMKWDEEEKKLLESYDKGEWKSIRKAKPSIRRYKSYVRATFRKDRRVNIRLSSKDLEGIQRRALEEGIPYQTLMASILHKFVSGTYFEKRA